MEIEDKSWGTYSVTNQPFITLSQDRIDFHCHVNVLNEIIQISALGDATMSMFIFIKHLKLMGHDPTGTRPTFSFQHVGSCRYQNIRYLY